jgi:hypothetical protein
MSETEAARFEDELFEAAASGTAAEVAFVDHVGLLSRYLEPRAGFDMGSSRARVEQLLAAGLRVQLIDPEPAPIVRLPAIDPDAEIVVTHVRIDVRGYDSVDAVLKKPDGTELKTIRDVGWDPDDGTMYAVCEGPLARLSATVPRVISQLIGIKDGERREIAVFEAVNTPAP